MGSLVSKKGVDVVVGVDVGLGRFGGLGGRRRPLPRELEGRLGGRGRPRRVGPAAAASETVGGEKGPEAALDVREGVGRLDLLADPVDLRVWRGVACVGRRQSAAAVECVLSRRTQALSLLSEKKGEETKSSSSHLFVVPDVHVLDADVMRVHLVAPLHDLAQLHRPALVR